MECHTLPQILKQNTETDKKSISDYFGNFYGAMSDIFTTILKSFDYFGPLARLDKSGIILVGLDFLWYFCAHFGPMSICINGWYPDKEL